MEEILLGGSGPLTLLEAAKRRNLISKKKNRQKSKSRENLKSQSQDNPVYSTGLSILPVEDHDKVPAMVSRRKTISSKSDKSDQEPSNIGPEFKRMRHNDATLKFDAKFKSDVTVLMPVLNISETIVVSAEKDKSSLVRLRYNPSYDEIANLRTPPSSDNLRTSPSVANLRRLASGVSPRSPPSVTNLRTPSSGLNQRSVLSSAISIEQRANVHFQDNTEQQKVLIQIPSKNNKRTD